METSTPGSVLENNYTAMKKQEDFKGATFHRIDSVERIVRLAKERKSVYFITKKLGEYAVLKSEEITRTPAAFVQNYQAVRLVSQIKAGYYYELPNGFIQAGEREYRIV